MEIIATVSGWYWVLSLLAGVAYAAILYYKDPLPYPHLRWKWVATAFRAIAVALIVLLLFNPYLKTEEKITEKPLLVLANDNSSSMSAIPAAKREALEKGWEVLQSAAASETKLKLLKFGNQVSDGLTADYSEGATDLSKLFGEIGNRFGNQHLAGIVIATDGIYNRGTNPLYTAEQLQVPVYIVALGDTTEQRDAAIKEIRANNLVFKGRPFPVLVSLEASLMAGQKANVSLYDITDGQKRLVEKQSWQIRQDRQFDEISFTATADKAGIRRYQVVLSELGKDVVPANNKRELYAEVIDDQTRVLLLAASPHPDITAIRQALESAPQYKVDLRFARDPLKLEEDPDLVILHQFPTQTTASSPWMALLQQKNWPCWHITGSQTSLTAFNRLQAQLQITSRSGATNKVTASVQPGFELFTLDAAAVKQFSDFPPLEAPFGEYRQAINLTSLFKQRIGAVEADFPLWAFNTNSRPRLAYTLGEGIWRWKLAQAEARISGDPLGDLIRKTVAYVGIKDDKRNFRAKSLRTIFQEQDELLFEAELYNANYEAVTEPDVNLSIRAAEGAEYKFTFGRSGDKYRLNAGGLPPGDYRFTATVAFNNKTEKAEGAFSIAALDFEKAQSRADHGLLRQMAAATGGAVISLEEMAGLAEKLKTGEKLSAISYYEQRISDLINLRWILALILSLLAFEWFVRRYSGGY